MTTSQNFNGVIMQTFFKIFIISSLFINSVAIGNDQEVESITNEQKIYGLMTIWSEVKFGFPYPDKAKMH